MRTQGDHERPLTALFHCGFPRTLPGTPKHGAPIVSTVCPLAVWLVLMVIGSSRSRNGFSARGFRARLLGQNGYVANSASNPSLDLFACSPIAKPCTPTCRRPRLIIGGYTPNDYTFAARWTDMCYFHGRVSVPMQPKAFTTSWHVSLPCVPKHTYANMMKYADQECA